MLEYRKTAAAFGEFLDANVYKVGYLIGTRGQTITQSMINYRLSSESYKRYWPTISEYAKKWLVNNPYDGGPWVVADCLGWLEMFWNGGWYDRPVTKSTYPDTTTGLVYKLVQIEGLPNGSIETIPKNCPYPIAVGYSGHVGFYYKGLVYQSAGHKSGTIRTYLASTEHNKAWQYWYMIPYLDYLGWKPNSEEGDDMIKYLEKSENVKLWQRALMDAGFDLAPYGADGSFGPLTRTKTNEFKNAVGLPIDDPATVTLVEWYAMQAYQMGHFDDGITQADLDKEIAKTKEALQAVSVLQEEIQGLKVQVNNRQDDLSALANVEKVKKEILARYGLSV